MHLRLACHVWLHRRHRTGGDRAGRSRRFSDSQLNALGLAAFLACVTLQTTRVIVLDGLLQAADEEHRATFVGYVVNKLLELSVQVIVVTYDEMLSKVIQHRYEVQSRSASRSPWTARLTAQS